MRSLTEPSSDCGVAGRVRRDFPSGWESLLWHLNFGEVGVHYLSVLEEDCVASSYSRRVPYLSVLE